MANISYGVNIIPKTNNAYTLGNSDYKWSNIYTVQINGTNVSDLGTVQDVQIDGTSILSNGVANIPYASYDNLGLVKANAMGIGIQDGLLYVNEAASSHIKAGEISYRPIVPKHQHESAFYGLAKAAGDSTQAASSNAVGTYTDNAKTAIQNMLSVAPINNPVFTGSISLGRWYDNDNPSDEYNVVGTNSIVMGYNCAATGNYSQAFGNSTLANANMSFTIGTENIAEGKESFCGGWRCKTMGEDQFAFGTLNYLDSWDNIPTWTAGTTYHVGDRVKWETTSNNTTVIRQVRCISENTDETFNQAHWINEYRKMKFVEIIGNGYISNELIRSNARALDWDGNEYLNGYLYVGCNADSSGGIRIPHDIQINGTSIVNNGVANIPIASDSTAGIIKTNGAFGLAMRDSPNQNQIMINRATVDDIKNASQRYKPITPSTISSATFYGLANAAGDSTQSASSNTVGNYTDTAKTAIHKMLDTANRAYKTIEDDFFAYFDDGADNLPLTDYQIFLPIGQEGTGDPSPTNTREIYGIENIYVFQSGKNLFDPATLLSIWIDTNNEITQPSDTKASLSLAHPYDYFTLSIKETVAGATMQLVYLDADLNVLRRGAVSCNTARTITLSATSTDTFYVLASITGYSKVSEIQFEYSHYETPYEEYKGNEYEFSWEDEAGYIYGGYLNALTGVLTVDKAAVQLGTLNYYTAGSDPLYFVCDSTQTNHITFGDRDFVCSQYKTVQATYWTSMPDYSIMGHAENNSLFRIRDSRYSDVASFKAALTEQGAMLVYTLETPLTYQLTPIEIKTFLGYNHIYASYGYIHSLAYPADTGLAIPEILINGKYVRENNIVNIPVASSELGLVKIDNANGVGITSGKLFVVKSNDAAVKAGTANYQPIVPSTQHLAAFYGLAKAAGDSTQAASSNAVGVYTANAKSAIQTMIGAQAAVEVIRL